MRLTSCFLASCFLLFSCRNGKEDNTPVADSLKTKDSPVVSRTERPAANPYATVDVSPMDMIYYPVDYPKLKMTHTASQPPMARVIYSRPHLQGRHIFHEVLKYDEPWRLGANEATELMLYKEAMIQDKKIKAGRYTLYCIPHKENWTVAINATIDTWGLEPDSTRDVARFVVPVKQTQNNLEYFTMVFEQDKQSANLLMAWDDVEVRLPFRF
ncbi:MAG: DUF2911 domain-containing protein [Chitinophagales bacterium]|nr:DUF2911 domain-containing protein [Chitinophagales bacterium]